MLAMPTSTNIPVLFTYNTGCNRDLTNPGSLRRVSFCFVFFLDAIASAKILICTDGYNELFY